jgi:hypothetical protein
LDLTAIQYDIETLVNGFPIHIEEIKCLNNSSNSKDRADANKDLLMTYNLDPSSKQNRVGVFGANSYATLIEEHDPDKLITFFKEEGLQMDPYHYVYDIIGKIISSTLNK